MKKIVIISILLMSNMFLMAQDTKLSTCKEFETSMKRFLPSTRVIYNDNIMICVFSLYEWNKELDANINHSRKILADEKTIDAIAAAFTGELDKEYFNSLGFYYCKLVFKDNAKHDHHAYRSNKILITK